MAEVNDRPHRATRRAPNEMLAEEQLHLHRLPDVGYTAVFGETRQVSWSATISFGGVKYSVPHTLARHRVGPRRRRRARRRAPRRAGSDRGGPPPAVDPGAPDDRRRALPAPTARGARTPAQGHQRGRGRVLGAGRRGPHVAGRSRRGGRVPGQGEDGRSGRLAASTAPNASTGRSAMRRSTGASPTATSLDPGRAPHRRSSPGRRGPLAPGRHQRLGRLRPMTAPAAPGRRSRRPVAPAAAPAHAQPRPRPAGHRQSAALGTRRSDAGPAGRRARRPASFVDRHPPQSGRVPDRQDLRRLGRDHLIDPAPTQRSLRTLEWIGRHENLVVCGPSGTGKTHFLEALGQAAIDAGHHVLVQPRGLGALMRRHRADDTTDRAIRRIMRADLIVIDDIGLLPVATETAEALYRVVDAAYERRASPSARTCTPPASTSSCPKPSPTRRSTGSCTTPTSCSPPATPSASPKPPPARG